MILSRKQIIISTKQLGYLMLGFILAFSPLLIRNFKVGAPLLSTNSIGAITAISPNHFYNKDGIFHIDAGVYAEILEKTNAKPIGSLIESIKSHPTIFSYIKSLYNRFTQAFSWIAHTDNVNHQFWLTQFAIQKVSRVNFWIIAPLSFVGIFFCFSPKRIKDMVPLIIMFLSTLAPLVLFYVLERYRLPLLAVLILFSGYGVKKLLQIKPRKIWLIGVGIFLVIFVWTNQLMSPNKKSIENIVRFADIYSSYFYYNDETIMSLIENEQYNEAFVIMSGFLENLPSFIYTFNARKKPKTFEQRKIIKYVIKLHTWNRDLASAGGNQTKVESQNRIIAQLQASLQ